MKVWFKRKTTSFFGKVIMLCRGPHCHVELQFSDGMFFSSREEEDGPSFKAQVDMEPGEYDCIPIRCTPEQEKIVRAQAELIAAGGVFLVKPKYGWTFIFTAYLPIPLLVEDDHVWICSEAVAACIQSIGLLLGYAAQGLSPDRMYRMLAGEINAWIKYQKGGVK